MILSCFAFLSPRLVKYLCVCSVSHSCNMESSPPWRTYGENAKLCPAQLWTYKVLCSLLSEVVMVEIWFWYLWQGNIFVVDPSCSGLAHNPAYWGGPCRSWPWWISFFSLLFFRWRSPNVDMYIYIYIFDLIQQSLDSLGLNRMVQSRRFLSRKAKRISQFKNCATSGYQMAVCRLVEMRL